MYCMHGVGCGYISVVIDLNDTFRTIGYVCDYFIVA